MIRLTMEKVATVGGVYHFRGRVTSQDGRFFRVNVTPIRTCLGRENIGFLGLSLKWWVG